VATSSIGRASIFLASGTTVSRALGFVRAIILAQALGVVASAGADAFAVANQLPNAIYAIVAGGVLSATLVPAIVRSAVHHDGGTAYINKLVTIALVVITATALAATLLAPVLVRLYAVTWSDEQLALASAFAYWCLPQVFFYGLYALLGEVLNARGSFGPFTWTPVANNVISIIGLSVFIALFGADSIGVRSVGDWSPDMVALLAGTATAGVALQALLLVLFWRRIGLRYRPDFRWRGVGLRDTGKMAGWTLAMILATQIQGVIEINVAGLASGTDASVFTIQTAWLIFMLPHSIIAVSLGTAYYTRMSTNAAAAKLDLVAADTGESLRRIGYFMSWAAAGLIGIALPFTTLFASTFQGVWDMGWILAVFAISLPAFSGVFILQRVLFALNDGRLAFIVTMWQPVLLTGLLIGCAFLPRNIIALGIAVSVSIITIGWIIFGAVLVRRRLGVASLHMGRSFALANAFGVVAAGVGMAVAWALGSYRESGWAMTNLGNALVAMLVIGVAVTLVYVLLMAVFRVPELRDARGLLSRRTRE
jgi:putative peptidoglycan lipid II flippase